MDRFVNRKIEKQTIYEIYRACRLCGAGGGYKMPIIQNVVNLDNCDVELKQKIRECVQIEVHQDDKMPPLICELCVDKVNDFYEFLEMCRQTNKRTRLKLGLPPQMLPRGAPDAGDCILGVTEPIFAQDEDSNEPLADKRSEVRGGRLKKESESKWRDVKVKVEKNTSSRESRASRHRLSSPPSPPRVSLGLRLRRDRRLDVDNVALSRLQVQKSSSPPPRSILKKGAVKKPEASPQSPSARLKRSREEPKPDLPAKRVKISLKPASPRHIKPSARNVSPRRRRDEDGKRVRQREEDGKKTRQKVTERQARDAQTACTVCGVVLKTLQAMLSHRRCHLVTYTDPRLACDPCGLWFPSGEEAEAHHRRHRRQALRYRCRHCGHSTGTLHAYHMHVERAECAPRVEVPDVKCDACWRTFPTQTLLAGHRCLGARARPAKCAKCGKTYATQKSLANHARACRKGDVTISPELRGRLKPVQIRVAKCDPLLANVKQEHYDVSNVKPNFGLDKNCVYPYISSGLRIKSEPSDCMVKINDLEFASYVHWDSDDDSGDSDTDDLDSLNLSGITKRRKVDSLAVCSLKVIFSNRLLGKVPRKFRRVKIETIIDSALNDSLSDLNINKGDDVCSKRDDTISNDNDPYNVKKDNEKEDDDLFPKLHSDVKVTNDDFDSLFSVNNDKTDNDDSGDNRASVSDDIIVAAADKISYKSENVKDLDSGANENVGKENNDSVNIMSNNNCEDTTGSTNESNQKHIMNKFLDLENVQLHENQLDIKIKDRKQKVSLTRDTINDLDKEIIGSIDTKLSGTPVENLNHNKHDNQCQQLENKREKLVESENVSTECDSISENDNTLYTKKDKESGNIEQRTETYSEMVETVKREKSESLNAVLEAGPEIQNKDTEITLKGNYENRGEGNIKENNVKNNFKSNVDRAQVNGDTDNEDVALNINDLEDLSGDEYDDCELMAEIDAQIGEKKGEGPGKQKETEKRDAEIEKPKEIVNTNKKIAMAETHLGDRILENTTATVEQMKEKEDNELDIEIKQDKITLEDLIPKEDTKSMDLDSISEDEFDFND